MQVKTDFDNLEIFGSAALIHPALQSLSSPPPLHSVSVLVWLKEFLWGRRGVWLCAARQFTLTQTSGDSNAWVKRERNFRACWIRINKNYRSICISVNRITQKGKQESVKVFVVHPLKGDVVSPPKSHSHCCSMCKTLSAACVLRMRLEFLVQNSSMYKERVVIIRCWWKSIILWWKFDD